MDDQMSFDDLISRSEPKEMPKKKGKKTPPPPPTPEEEAAFALLLDLSRERRDSLNVPDSLLEIDPLLHAVGVYLKVSPSPICHISIREEDYFIRVPEEAAGFLPDCPELANRKSDRGMIVITIASGDQVALIKDAFSEEIALLVERYHTFDCCSRYVACSDAKRCIHPQPEQALGCYYAKNLRKGRIFYGMNKNI